MSTAAQLTPIRSDSKRSVRATNRYDDAYSQAKFIVGVGNVIKGVAYVIVGLFIAGAMALVGHPQVLAPPLTLSQVGSVATVFGLLGFLIAGFVYVGGILICARGQHLKAALDCAVNSSPFLSDDQRARAMSLD